MYKKEYEKTSIRYQLKLSKRQDAHIIAMLESYASIYPKASINGILRESLYRFLLDELPIEKRLNREDM